MPVYFRGRSCCPQPNSHKPSCTPSSAAAPVSAGVAGLEAVLMHSVCLPTFFLSKGRNFIKPLGQNNSGMAFAAVADLPLLVCCFKTLQL